MEEWYVRSSEKLDNNSISLENKIQIQSPWISGTPVNPVPYKSPQIYSRKPPNGLDQPYNSYTSQVIRQKFDELVESNRVAHDFSLSGGSRFTSNDAALMRPWNSITPAITDAGLGSISFIDQLALADASACSPPIFNFVLDSSPSLLLASQNLKFQSRHEDVLPGSLSYDLNSIPIDDTIVPVTPAKSSIGESTEVPNAHNLCLTIETVLEVKNNEIANVSMELEKGSTIDLNQTPRQQKPRRKKHRPRVVKEGALKRTRRSPNPVVFKETTPTGKRKYVRRNTQNNNSCTTTPSQTEKHKGMARKTNVKPRSSCRRPLNFDLDEQPHTSPTLRIPDDYRCNTSTCVNEEVSGRGSKRQHSQTFCQQQCIASSNLVGSHCDDTLQHFLFDLHAPGFPELVKKKRTEKVTLSTFSSVTPNQMATPRNNGNSSSISFNISRGLPVTFQALAIPNLPEKFTKKKRTKVKTRVRDSLPIGEQKTTLQSLIEGTQGILTKKKRTRKEKPTVNFLVSGTKISQLKLDNAIYDHQPIHPKTEGTLRKEKISIEALGHKLNRLHISSENPDLGKHDMLPNENPDLGKHEMVLYENPNVGKHGIVPRRIVNLQEENAIVLYRGDGAIVSLEGSVRKRRPRPKVDLDEETTRVWKLLLENINNDGIDGNDVEKAKWWEDERSIFNGRANSFIARMHLVQGDRRFSQWKGSVLDSVIGVFLTQNVSDHLSSSAFMSLGSRFPLKSNGSHEEMTVQVKEKDICIVDLMDTIEWNGNTSIQPACTVYQEIVNNCEFFGGKDSENKALDFFESAILANSGSTWYTSNSEIKEANESLITEGKAMGDVILSPNSIVSSQNSTDLSINLTGEKIGSCSGSNSEPEDLTMVCKFSDVVERPYSFMERLQITGTTTFSEFCSEKNNNILVEVDNLEMLEEDRSCHFSKNSVDELSGLTVECTSKSTVEKNVENFKRKEIAAETLSSKLLKKYQPSLELKNPKNIENLSDESNRQASIITGKRGPRNKEPQEKPDWSKLKREAEACGKNREKTANTMDSLDWEAVRLAHVDEIADAIKERGMNNMLAERIKALLNRLVEEHGNTDLEWLRDVPPDKAKEYLLSIRGLGLKSVECVRLLTLHHLAFPVDTNVGRIAVRLGWVPLQPLPESLQLHLLELYPVLESIQKYLWPRLCKLDQKTLYELHYQMITFGKVFCTKSKPNCNACPMRAECRHFASAYASARLALPGPEEKNLVTSTRCSSKDGDFINSMNPCLLLPPPSNQQTVFQPGSCICNPIIEEPASPEPEKTVEPLCDIEDTICCVEDIHEIPTINLNIEEFKENLQNYIQMNMECHLGEMSQALVALTPEAASIPMPKLKNVNRLRTEHQVYELPDLHPLLNGFDKREADDPSSYLLAIWTPGETASSFEMPESKCGSRENGMLCEHESCLSCNSFREANSQTVRGTILIPCRTANRGSFPLNGTYFQVNEVFADHNSSLTPIDVPRSYLWNLSRRTVYFGTSIPTIFKGLSTEGIQHCFWRGFVCVRGFDRKFRAPRPLMARLHLPASKLKKTEKT